MTIEQLAELARQLSVIIVLLGLGVCLHREWLVLGREYRTALDRATKAEKRADDWQGFALAQLGVSERAVGAAERVLPPRGDQ